MSGLLFLVWCLKNSQSAAVFSNWLHPQTGQRIDVMGGELQRGTEGEEERALVHTFYCHFLHM